MPSVPHLLARLLTRVSAPVITFVISLFLVGVGLVVLWRLHLAGKFFASSGFQIAAFVLALLAIIFGSIQFWDSRIHSGKMEQLARSMSTRYIGIFPKDMDDIIEVINLADQELLIMSDTVDYGSYSRPETYQRLLNAVLSARERGVSVRWLAYGEKPGEETLLSQFKEADFDDTRNSPKFRNYFKYWSGKQPPETHAEFLTILREKEKDFLKDLRDKGTEIHTLSEKVWLFFFMQDKQDAVFLFEDIGAEEQGLAFRTRDAKLVETFCGIFNRYWKPTPTRGLTAQPRAITADAGSALSPSREIEHNSTSEETDQPVSKL
jgi:hypothetical protein